MRNKILNLYKQIRIIWGLFSVQQEVIELQKQKIEVLENAKIQLERELDAEFSKNEKLIELLQIKTKKQNNGN